MKKNQNKKRENIFDVFHIDNPESGKKALKFKNVILRIIPDSERARCCFKPNDGVTEDVLNLHKPSIVAIEDETTVLLTGKWRIEVADTDNLAALFSFIEMGSKANAKPLRDFILPNEVSPRVAGSTYKVLLKNITLPIEEILLFSQFSNYSSQYNDFYKCLRRRESYGLVNFLITTTMEASSENIGKKIYDICKEYGVSASYFRRLCVKNLTCSAKGQLNSWRGAHSVLNIMESNEDIFSIAMRNGYASSSHLSADIKKNFGLSPKQFRVIQGILYE